MILYFLRHGEAGEPRDTSDDARQLTAEGEHALRRAAALWGRLNLRPDVVLTSPLSRAMQTAELACEGLNLRQAPIPEPALAPGAGWGDMARALSRHADARRVLFVGHEPDLSRAVALLTGSASIRMRKGGLACVEFYGIAEPGGGEIAWLLDPDLYADGSQTAAERIGLD